MFLKRILVTLAACSASIFLYAPLAQAGQVGGQIGISLTIVKSCQVASESSANAYVVSSQGCDSSAFQLQNEQGKQLATQSLSQDAVTRIDNNDASSPRVVVYW